MDMLSPPPRPQPTPSKQPWPHTRAQRGLTYGTPDPIHQGDMLVVMLNDTWLDYGTMVEKMRRDLKAALEAGEKLKVSYDTAIKELADLRTRYENLRAAEKRRRQVSMGLVSNKPAGK